jgi:hypothetical protein
MGNEETGLVPLGLLPGNPSNTPWAISSDASVVVGNASSGDYNASALVEQADLDLVLLNWGKELLDPRSLGWTHEPPTGPIDQAELDAVLLNWGKTPVRFAGAALASGVPEPTAGALAFVAIMGAILSARRSRRRIPLDPRHAVEVGVVAGEVDETVKLHDGHCERIVGQKSELLTNCGRGANPLRLDRQHCQPRLEHVLDRTPEASQLLERARLPLQPLDDLGGPAEYQRCLKEHQAMPSLAQDACRCKSPEVCRLDASQKPAAVVAEYGMR